MNDPDLYITLFYEVTGHLKNDIPTTDELGNEFIKYKIFKHWNKNRKLNKWKKVN
jgi:DNA topoisomerase IB